MAGWALRVSVMAASPASMTSRTSQPRRSEARSNGQPAGSLCQGAPLPLATRPWPGKVNAVFSCMPGSYLLSCGCETNAQSGRVPRRRTVTATLVGDTVNPREGSVAEQPSKRFQLPAAGQRPEPWSGDGAGRAEVEAGDGQAAGLAG